MFWLLVILGVGLFCWLGLITNMLLGILNKLDSLPSMINELHSEISSIQKEVEFQLYGDNKHTMRGISENLEHRILNIERAVGSIESKVFER
ncbi:MAG: hypothetical protein AAB130_01070 [Nitrospirota bacterium]